MITFDRNLLLYRIARRERDRRRIALPCAKQAPPKGSSIPDPSIAVVPGAHNAGGSMATVAAARACSVPGALAAHVTLSTVCESSSARATGDCG
jgi:hypothetical protein